MLLNNSNILKKTKTNIRTRKKRLTFFFFLKVIRTPSTETSIDTFFFLIPFALNSYCNATDKRTIVNTKIDLLFDGIHRWF